MQFPFVSRRAYEESLATAAKELEAARSLGNSIRLFADEEVIRIRKEADVRVATAEARADQAAADARQALSESRRSIRDAIELSKTASAALFGVNVEGELEPAPSVGQADRQAAQRIREDEQSARLTAR